MSSSEFERLYRVGGGSVGTVYRVIHRPTSRVFALKSIHGYYDEKFLSRIYRDVQILRDLDHANVVKCHDVFDHNREIQLLLEFMDRGSLEGSQIQVEHVLSDIARQVLSGLLYLHSRHIVHHEIKPSNLLRDSRNNVKIADFMGGSRILDFSSRSTYTSIAYMSPERIDTSKYEGVNDACAGDIWSFGVSMLEVYLGRFPFANGRKEPWVCVMLAICMSEPPEAPPTASREFREFIACCLQRDPRRRLTAEQLLQHPFILRGGLQRPFIVRAE